MDRFGLSEIQAQAILDMRLARLQGLEREKIESEYEELAKKVIEICPNVILHSYINVAKKIGVKRIHLPLRLMNENVRERI